MKKITILFIFTCALLIPDIRDCFGQSITWQKVLNNNYGSIQKIQQTTDGGYIALGSDRLNNQRKIYLTKLDSLGNVLWFKHIGLGENMGNWVEQTTDGGFIIGGATNLDIGNSRAYLIKTDDQGNITWEKTFVNSNLDQCYCVKQTSDGGYILSCRTTPAFSNIALFIRTDSSGNLIWQKVYSDNSNVLYIREIQILENGFIVAGGVGVQDSSDVYLMRLNIQGDTIWTKKIGGNKWDGASSIDKVENTGFIIGGSSNSFSINNERQAYVIRIDTMGNLLWQNTYSGLGIEGCSSIRYVSNRGFVFAGDSDSLNNFNFRAKIRVIDMNSSLLFENSFLPDTDGSVFYSIDLTIDGGFIAAGSASFPGSVPKMFIVKTDSLLLTMPIGIQPITGNQPLSYRLSQNFPNPFNPSTTFRFDIKNKTETRITIFDILGNEIDNLYFGTLRAGSYSVKWDSKNNSSGVYFYKLFTNEYSETRKMIILK
jgi:hypothetical protein